ncbi:MAG: helix-turn-helix domain-containing protein [Saprospiraceae bacterium]
MSIKDFLFTVSLLGIIQGILIASMVLFQSGKKPNVQWLLGGLFLMGVMAMIMITLVNSDLVVERHWMKIMEEFIILLTGPMLYWYIRLQTFAKLDPPFSILFHFSPAFLWLGYCLAVFQLPSVPFFVFVLHFQTYTFLSAWDHFHRKRLHEKGLHTYWATLLLCFFVLLCVGQWLRFAFSQQASMRLIVPSLAACSFYVITLIGFQRSTLWLSLRKQNRMVKNVEKHKWEAQRQALEVLMREKARYSDPFINRNKLAHELNIHPNQLTNLIHEYHGLSFTDYINQLRLEKVRLLLIDPEKQLLTLEAIGNEAGFQSRSAFYRLFRDATGKTPAAYRKEHLG